MLDFADDIDIIGRHIRAVKDACSKLESEENFIRLHLNEDKMKFLMVSPSQWTRNLVGSHLEVRDKRFEVLKELKYLGALVND
jgi:hypothetical protein